MLYSDLLLWVIVNFRDEEILSGIEQESEVQV